MPLMHHQSEKNDSLVCDILISDVSRLAEANKKGMSLNKICGTGLEEMIGMVALLWLVEDEFTVLQALVLKEQFKIGV